MGKILHLVSVAYIISGANQSVLLHQLVFKFLYVNVLNIPPTAKVIWRQGHSLKSHSRD